MAGHDVSMPSQFFEQYSYHYAYPFWLIY